jgi:UDP-glucose 4-epimerase
VGRCWIVGRSGLLGHSLSMALGSRPTFENRPIAWSDPGACDDIASETRRFLDDSDGPWTIVWCAGAGIIGTARSDLDHETAILARLLEVVADRGPGTFFLTSSAGGVYGGSRDIPITETSQPAPLSEYGANKLTQESLVQAWAQDTGGRAVIGRVANLYGPGQRLSKPQGLISQICLATLTRRPVPVYVSLDTLRDYIYVDDCSQAITSCLRHGEGLAPGDTVTKILASESSLSIGGVLAQAKRVLGRMPSVVMVPSATAGQQGSALAFRSTVWPDVAAVPMTPLPVGIHRTAEYLRRQLQLGRLA